jgi:tetratricopeptide (TPR) repeat protein/predicted Ser/Thr protein kinase
MRFVADDTRFSGDEHPDSEVEETLIEGSAILPHDEKPTRGDTIGRYVLLGEIGFGAMGVVFAAYDPDLDRKVAVKILRPRSSGGTQGRSRMQREAQALAKLTHPNVVVVHDVGIHEGRVFLAMEFIDGQTIGDWVESSHPSWREIVEKFVEAGRGLEAAHSAGLVHRDFKPENVMIDRQGRARVMDFGLARAQDESEAGPSLLDTLAQREDDVLSTPLTQTGAMMGTPAYMAPEQFLGGTVDARSDQFSFCVTLYEALYRDRPFGGETMAAIGFAVTRGEVRDAPRGSDVPLSVRRILLRGLSTHPAKRWASIAELCKALQPAPARTKRWLVAAGISGGAVAGAVGLALVRPDAAPSQCADLGRRIADVWNAEVPKRIRASLRASGAGHADETADTVTREMGDYADGWVRAATETCQATEAGEQSDYVLDLAMACLGRRRAAFAATLQILEEADGRIAAKALAMARGLPGVEPCADTNALLAAIPPPEDEATRERVERLEADLEDARALGNAGRIKQAQAIVERVMPEALNVDYGPTLARAKHREADLLGDLGEYEKAHRLESEAFALAVRHDMKVLALKAARDLVFLDGYRLKRYPEARAWGGVALAYSDALDSESRSAGVLSNLGVTERAAGRVDDAREYYERSLEIRERVLEPDDPALAVTLNNLANLLKSEGDYERAQPMHERALKIRRAAYGDHHPAVADSHNNLGTTAESMGRYADARAHHEQALNIRRAAFGNDHPQVSKSLMNLGTVARIEGDIALAREHYAESLAVLERARGPDDPSLRSILEDIGMLELHHGDRDAARPWLERSLAVTEAALGPDHLNVAGRLVELAVLEREFDAFERAHQLLDRALRIRTSRLGPDDPAVASVHRHIGYVALEERNFDAALRSFETALASRQRRHGADHRRLAPPLDGLAAALMGLGHAERAIETLQRSEKIRGASHASSAGLAGTRLALSKAHHAAGHHAEALASLDAARSSLRPEDRKTREAVEAWAAELR